jgi:hypothetical protein
MNKLIFFIGICALFVSCKEKEHYESVPKALIPKEKMIDLITNLTILESTYQAKYVQVTRYSWLLQQEADSLFKANGITRQQYDESLTYYNKQHEEMVEMYQEVKTKLQAVPN